MEIKSSFNKSFLDSLAEKIYKEISETDGLSFRKLSYIRKQLKAGSILVAFKGRKLIGFIIREKIYKKYFELKSWYVIPKERKKGVGKRLLESALSDKDKTYLISTFDLRPLKIAVRLGFKKISYMSLPKSLLIKYLATRSLRSTYRHLFMQKSTLLIK